MKSTLKILFVLTWFLFGYYFYVDHFRPACGRMYRAAFGSDTVAVVATIHDTVLVPVMSPSPSPSPLIRPDTTKPNVDSVKMVIAKRMFVNGSDEYEKSVIDERDYDALVRQLAPYLCSKFSARQLSYVQSIHLIDWEDLNDNVAGMTAGSWGNSSDNVIYLPVLNDSYYKTVLHEMWHGINSANNTLFQAKYADKWSTIDNYVTDYAETALAEDIAETGMYYSMGKITADNGKFNIIAQYYKDTY